MSKLLYEGMPLSEVRFDWRTRLVAWWEGFDLEAIAKQAQKSADQAKARLNEVREDMSRAKASAPPEPVVSDYTPGLDRHGRALWTLTRIQMAELMYGEGFIEPGGTSWIPKLIATLPLNPTASLLDLTAGLGGVSKIVTEKFSSYVDGYDQNTALVEVCAERLGKLADPSKASVQPYDPGTMAINRRYEFCMALNLFYTVRDKDRLWQQLVAVLKDRGQLVFTDFYLANDADPDKGALKAWCETERVEPHLTQVQDATAGLTAAGFDVRTVEDITNVYKQGLKVGLGKLHDHLQQNEMDAETRQMLADELALMTRRVRALDSGLLVKRVHAILPVSAGPDPLFKQSQPV
jgi:SAM-dependent methyltransferase